MPAFDSKQWTILDADLMTASFGSDREFAAQTIRLFMRDAPGLARSALASLRAEDNAGLVAHAHALKGIIGYFTKGELHEAVRELEMLGREGALPVQAVRALGCWARMDPSLQRLLLEMEELLAESS